MTIETSLGQYLEDYVALADDRVYAKKLPQNPTLPALTYLRVAAVPEYSHSGYSHLTNARFQVSCWAETYATVRQLAAQVRTALDGYSGFMGTTQIGSCFCKGDRDLEETDTGRQHVPLDFDIGFND